MSQALKSPNAWTDLALGILKNLLTGSREHGLISLLRGHIEAGYSARILKRFIDRHRLRCETAHVKGGYLHLPSRRGGIVEELLLYGVHEPVATAEYSKILAGGDMVVDIGTNIGYYLLVASNRIAPDGVMYGFEPDPELFECATINSQLLPVKTSVMNIAVSNDTGHVNFHRSVVPNYGSLVYSPKLGHHDKIKVETIRLDDFCSEHGIHPTVIRMDIEGGEVEALRGAKDVLSESRPKLFLELHPDIVGTLQIVQILEQLASNGYSKVITIRRFHDRPWVPAFYRNRCARVSTLDALIDMTENRQFLEAFSIIAKSDMTKGTLSWLR